MNFTVQIGTGILLVLTIIGLLILLRHNSVQPENSKRIYIVTAHLRRRSALESKAVNMIVRHSPHRAQMFPVCLCQRQLGEQRGQRLVDHLVRGFIRGCVFGGWLPDLIGPGSTFRRKTVYCQSITNFSISLRVTDSMNSAIKRKHPSALAAMPTAPGIDMGIQPHLSAAVAADGAISVHHPGAPSPPDIQAEKGRHVQNGKGKI